MKKVDFWANSCLRKKSFKTFELATQVANKKTKVFKTTYRVYNCPICFNFHLTKKSQIKETEYQPIEVKPNNGESVKVFLENGKKTKAVYKNNKFFSKNTGKEITEPILKWKLEK